MAEKQFAAGESIYNEGENAAFAYVVLSGTVEILKISEGKPLKTGEAKEGELFGETGIFDANAPHINSARAKNDVKVDTITFDELSQMVEQSPPRLIPVISTVFERLQTTIYRAQKQQQPTAVQEADADGVTVTGANDFTKELIPSPVTLQIAHLPLRIGGYPKDDEPDRHHGNHVHIPTDGPPLTVSAHHCEVICEEGKLYVRDMGSRFGTTANGFTVGRGKGEYKVALQKGDNLVILGDKKNSEYHVNICVD